MAGLIAGQDERRVSTPYFDDVTVNDVASPAPNPCSAPPGQTPLYGGAAR